MPSNKVTVNVRLKVKPKSAPVFTATTSSDDGFKWSYLWKKRTASSGDSFKDKTGLTVPQYVVFQLAVDAVGFYLFWLIFYPK